MSIFIPSVDPILNSFFTLQVIEAIVDVIGAERTGIRVSPGGDVIHSATEEFPIKTGSYLLSQL